MPNDRPGNRRPADEAARVATTGSATQATQEAFQNSMQAAADRIQAQGLGPELESAFSQIFDKVFDSILKSFSASSQRVLGGTAAASTGGGGPVTMGGAASHGTYAPSVTSSASYAIGVRNQLAPTTVATGGVGGARTLAGLPVGIPAGQTGVTTSASVYGLPPTSAGVAQVGYSGGSAILSGAAQMAASAPGMPNYASQLAPLGTSAAGLPATAPPLVPTGLPATAPPIVPPGSGSPFAGYSPLSYFGGARGIGAASWRGAKALGGRAFSGMGSYGANLFGSLAGSATIGLINSISQNQQDLIDMNMLATQTRQGNADNVIVNQVNRGAAMNRFGYTQSDIANAMQSYLPWTQGPNQANNVGIGAFNQLAGFGSATGVGMQSAAQFVGQLGQAGIVGGARGGMGLGNFMNMAAVGMGASAMNNPQDWMSGLSQIMQQQTNMGLISSPQITKSLTGYYSAFNQTGIAGLSGTAGAGVMNQINQGVANFQSSPYTTQQAYSALGGNLTPADVSYITSGGAFNPQPLLGGQTPFQKYMNYANRQWGSLGTVAEAYQLAPMLGMTTYATGQLLQSNLMKNTSPTRFNENLKSFSTLAQKAGIDLTSPTGQTTVMDLANIAAAGNDPKQLAAVAKHMNNEKVAGVTKQMLAGKTTQQDLANLLRGGVSNPADPIRKSMDALQNTMTHFYERNHTDMDRLTGSLGGVGGLMAAAILPTMVKGFGSVVASILGSSVVRGGASAVGGGVTSVVGGALAGIGGGSAVAGGALLAGATAGGLALGGVVGKAVTMGTDQLISWKKYESSIRAFLKSPAGRGFGVKSDMFGGLVVTDGKTTIPVKSWGEVHQRMLGKEKHYVLETTGNWFSPAQKYDIGSVTATATAASTNAAAAITRQHSTRAAAAPGGSTTTGAGSGGTGPVTAVFDVVNVHIPQNAIAQLVNGQWVFAGTAGVSVTSRDPKHGGSTGSGRPRSNRQGPGPS